MELNLSRGRMVFRSRPVFVVPSIFSEMHFFDHMKTSLIAFFFLGNHLPSKNPSMQLWHRDRQTGKSPHLNMVTQTCSFSMCDTMLYWIGLGWWFSAWHHDFGNENSSNADWATFLASLLIERLHYVSFSFEWLNHKISQTKKAKLGYIEKARSV